MLDMVTVKRALAGSKTRLIGPNCPGVITPGNARSASCPATSTPRAMSASSRARARSPTRRWRRPRRRASARSTCIGIGGDPVNGTNFIDCLELFLGDPETQAIIMIGEIGGSAEEEAAEFLKRSKVKKPMVGFIAGATAPPGRRMGHAGAIISGGSGTAADKMEAMRSAGITVADSAGGARQHHAQGAGQRLSSALVGTDKNMELRDEQGRRRTGQAEHPSRLGAARRPQHAQGPPGRSRRRWRRCGRCSATGRAGAIC